MFTRKEQLLRKTGANGVDRQQFLSLLIQEFEKSQSVEAQKQVLANLANFSYDPINYPFIRELKAIDIFLKRLLETEEEFVHFSLAGLCNLCNDPENADYIVRSNGIFLISQQLLHRNVDIALNSLTALLFLITPETQPFITTPDIINKVLHYQNSPNVRLKNLAEIFLNDYCTQPQITSAKSAKLNVLDIPLPNYK